MRDIDEGLMRQAHKGLEAMSLACAAIRDNDLGAADRALAKAQEITGCLMKDVGDKSRAAMQSPAPDTGDRG
jgi:hypothetical protein